MLIYVESNFILEIAFEQQEMDSAEEILSLTEAGKLELVIPAFALSESFSTIRSKRGKLIQLTRDLGNELAELRRTRSFAVQADELDMALPAILDVVKRDTDNLVSVTERMLAVARTIPMTANNFAKAQEYEQRFGMKTFDSIMLATVMGDLAEQSETQLKCFPNRNSNDFDKKDITDELAKHNCKYVPSFNDGLSYAKSKIRA